MENPAKSLHAVAYLKEEIFREFVFEEIDGEAEVCHGMAVCVSVR